MRVVSSKLTACSAIHSIVPRPYLDEEGRLRADGKELDPAIQDAVAKLWQGVNTETLRQLSDFEGYKREFLQLFGFEVDGVDYTADVNPEVPINNMV